MSSTVQQLVAAAIPLAYVRTKDVYASFGQKVTQRAVHAGWITPRQRRKGFTIFAVEDVQQVQRRLLAGEFPPLLPCEERARQEAKLPESQRRALVEARRKERLAARAAAKAARKEETRHAA